MESFKISPSSTSHITHTRSAKINEEGIQAHIFIGKPLDDGYESVEPNTVHLVMAPKGQMFKKFKNVGEHEKLILTLAVYLNLLEFFETSWVGLKTEIEKKFKIVRKKNQPLELHSDIHFYLSATAYYERWFDDIFLHFKKCSTDFTAGQIFLQQGGKSLTVNPEVMHGLALSRSSLFDILLKAGYNDNTLYAEMQS
jgi:hypothetical protein